MNLISGPGFNRLHGAIGAAELRQRVIADNVANVDTPYFKRSDVVFEEALEQALNSGDRRLDLRRTNEKHLPAGGGGAVVQPKVVTDEWSVMNNNVNNVDIDREMALQAKNQLRYNALITQLNHEFRMFRTAVEGRA